MSFSGDYVGILPLPIAALQYRDIARPMANKDAGEPDGSRTSKSAKQHAEVEMSEAEFAARIRQERADAQAQLDQKLCQDYEQKLIAARAPLVEAIKSFAEQRVEYFARVEAEVVQLALSIAAKILHREAQVDSMLVATLVRMAVEKMHEESSVTVRVGAGRGANWKQYFAQWPNLARVEVAEDPNLSDQDCLLETGLGTANFGLDTQLKEVEQGFFDLLAQRPQVK